MARFEAGETVVIEQTVKDARSGQPRDPTSIVVTITDPNGLAVVTAQSMVNVLVGEWRMDYLLPLTAPLGIYEVLYHAVSGTRVTRQRDSFEVHS
jgi:uncharacterized protein YfaS (alpha-2-macroglobulin family)